jgi:acetyl-CoA carboxylase biotin carboxylase subunit
MGESAVRMAKAAGYVNAGTCEFLLDHHGDFYFLEMNTRIQVEHPVTELVTGIDLVQWQLRIAAGEKLPFVQSDISPRGWSIECRITSEDASNNFLPSTGRIDYLHLPSGPGVRWDGGIESGSEVSLYYDPMLAKLIVWGADREQAVTRMRRALVDLIVQGVETSRDFHIRMMDDEEFRRGAIDIQWLERRLADIVGKPASEDATMVAAVAGVLLAERDRSARAVSVSPGMSSSGPPSAAATDSWKQAGRMEGLRS